MKRNVSVIIRLVCLFAGVILLSDAAFALTATAIGTHVTKAMSTTAKIMQSVALVAGIGFVVTSFFKFHQHKQNPTQVPLSQGLALLVIGAGLVMIPTLIPTAESVITGSTGSTAKVSGSSISKLIGS